MKHSWKWNSSPSTLFISPHLNIPHNTFSNRQNCNYIIAKRNSSSYNKFFTSLTGKKPLFPLTFVYLYKNQLKTFGLPPNRFNLIVLSSCECSWFKCYVSDKHFYENETGLVTDELPKPEPLLFNDSALPFLGPSLDLIILFSSSNNFAALCFSMLCPPAASSSLQ